MTKRRKNFNEDDFKIWFQNLAEVDDNGCWNWPLQKKSGYGNIRYKQRMYRCHRLSFTLFVEPIDNDIIIRHKCHNKACYNPDHLIPGDFSQNAYDSRHYHPQTKLNETKVREIRNYFTSHQKFGHGEAKQAYEILGSKYGVTPACIKSVRFNVQWKDVV